jgi:hypothetical protein
VKRLFVAAMIVFALQSAAFAYVINLRQEDAALTIQGGDITGHLGIDLAAGELNGDAYDDLLIGSSDAANFKGEAYVVFGREWAAPEVIDLAQTPPDVRIRGKAAGDALGYNVGLCDVNDDGKLDLLIAAPGAIRPDSAIVGALYVFYGPFAPGTDINLASDQADLTIYGKGVIGDFGRGASCGDINDDGRTDLLIGAPEDMTAAGDDAGKAFVIYGAAWPAHHVINLGVTAPDITLVGDEDGTKLGYATAVGDVNDDGIDDIIVGGPGYLWFNPGEGVVRVIYGRADFPANHEINFIYDMADITIYGGDQDGYLGVKTLAVDVNGDGVKDLLMSAKGAWTGVGEAYALYGRGDFPAEFTLDLYYQHTDVLYRGEGFHDNFGAAMAAGDINADGLPDMVFGSPNYKYKTYDKNGKAYAVFSADDWPAEQVIDLLNVEGDFEVIGRYAQSQTGAAVAAGDLDGDGLADIAVSAPYSAGGGGASVGEVYVIPGSYAPDDDDDDDDNDDSGDDDDDDNDDDSDDDDDASPGSAAVDDDNDDSGCGC